MGKTLSRQVSEQAQGKVAVLLTCRCELSLLGVELGEEGVARADGAGQLCLAGKRDGQRPDVVEVELPGASQAPAPYRARSHQGRGS